MPPISHNKFSSIFISAVLILLHLDKTIHKNGKFEFIWCGYITPIFCILAEKDTDFISR